jgi:hypothetical protein
MMHGYG